MMCGLWGFHGPEYADPKTLSEAARLASRRGPDSWGIVTETADRRGMGRLPEQVVDNLPPSRLVVGHCRLSTVLGTKTVTASQPIRCGRFVVAHNGTVPNAQELTARYGLTPSTGNDSEVIGLLLACMAGPSHQRLSDAMRLIEHGGRYAVSIMDTFDNQVVLLASGIPLWRLSTDRGTYWASVRPGDEWEPVHG